MFQFLVLFQFLTFATLGAPKVRLGGSGGAAEAPPQGKEKFEFLWCKSPFLDPLLGFPWENKYLFHHIFNGFSARWKNDLG